MESLFHISEVSTIARFEPRPHPIHGSVVWAVDQAHIHNYFLPRQCPRVAFFVGPQSDPADIDRLMGTSTARFVIAIESHWIHAVAHDCVYQYTFSPEGFTLLDANAGYYLSREVVVPLAVTPITDLLGALLQHDIELRVMPSLWKLREQVIASTLSFSIIRMRNARPPHEGYAAYHPL